MLTAHFLAVTPDGCPEEIEAGPFTEERARDALFAWEMNHGCPARVVCLAEAVEPVAYVVCEVGKTPRRIVLLDNGHQIGTGADANTSLSAIVGLFGPVMKFEVFGLVPAKG